MNKLFFIISAELSTLDKYENMKQTFTLEHDLNKLELQFKRVEGCYNGTSEAAFLVIPKSTDSLKESLIGLARDYGQECILMREPMGPTYLIYASGNEEYIGEWRQVPEWVAKDNGAYTVSDDKYYITVVYKDIEA